MRDETTDPLHAGASSKAFLAFLDEEQVAEYLRQRLTPLTENTTTDAGRLRRELGVIARRGLSAAMGALFAAICCRFSEIFGKVRNLG